MSISARIHVSALALCALTAFGCGGSTPPPQGPSSSDTPATAAPATPAEAPPVVAGDILAELTSGSTKIVVENCPFDVPPPKGKADPLTSIAQTQDHLYVANGSPEVRAYRIEPGCKLVLDKSVGAQGVIKLPGEVASVSAAENGSLLASHGIFDAHWIRDGVAGAACGQRYAVLHPSGTWGVSHFPGSDPNKIDVAQGACSTKPWFLSDLSDAAKRKGPFKNIMHVAFGHGMTLVGGADGSEPSKYLVIGFDDTGKEKVRIGAGEAREGQGFGWVHGIAACGPGICVGDTNYKQVSVWGVDGKYMGRVQLDSDLKLGGLWIHALTEHQGSVLVGLTVWGDANAAEKAPKVLRMRVRN